jgi:hypothetical protein
MICEVCYLRRMKSPTHPSFLFVRGLRSAQQMIRSSTVLGSLLVGTAAFLMSAQTSSADTLVSTDFADGTFSQLGWSPYTINDDGTADTSGAWQTYDASAYGAGTDALYNGFASDNGALTHTFSTTSSTAPLTLTVDAGWLRDGAGGDPSTELGVELLDSNGNGYVFLDHNANAAYGAAWALVSDYTIGAYTYADIDTAQSGLVSGGSLEPFTITRDANGDFTLSNPDFTGGPASPGNIPTNELTFTDTTTTSFDQVALLAPVGGENYGAPLFNNVELSATVAPEPGTLALMMTGVAGLAFLAVRKSKLSLS